jgi:hypothetical protein
MACSSAAYSSRAKQILFKKMIGILPTNKLVVMWRLGAIFRGGAENVSIKRMRATEEGKALLGRR